MNIESVRAFAHKEMEKWGLVGWTFSFNNAISYAGVCYGNKKEIRLSKPICKIESDDFIKDTIRHEIAHAKAGCRHGHDIVWQNWARKIGASTDACYEESRAIKEVRMSRVKYVMCFGGQVVQTYLRRPNKKTVATIKERWIPGIKEETFGNLYFENYNPLVHTKFLEV